MSKLQIFGAFVGIVGFSLLVWQGSFLAAVAVFLMIYGNNLERYK